MCNFEANELSVTSLTYWNKFPVRESFDIILTKNVNWPREQLK